MPADLPTNVNAGDVEVNVVRFNSERDIIPRVWTGPLRSLLGNAPVVRATKAGTPCFSAAQYQPEATRGLAGVVAVTLLVLDFDHLTAAQLHHLFDQLTGRLFAIYSSYSDLAAGEDDRCVRVLLVPTRSMTPSEFRVVRAAVVTELGVPVDENAADASRIWFDPSTPAERAESGFIIYGSGAPLDPQQYLAAVPPAEPPATTGTPDHEHRHAAQPRQEQEVSLGEVKARLRRLRDEDSVVLLGPVLAGQAFAALGNRNDSLWKVMSKAAFIAPNASPEVLVELVQPSLAVMAAETPEGALTAADARSMAARALDDAHENGIRVFQRGDEAEIAVHLLDELATTEAVVHDEGQFYRYQEATGLWEVIEDEEISRAIQGFAGSRVLKDKHTTTLRITAAVVRGTRVLAAARARTQGFFENALPGFAFSNGFVRVDGNGLHLEPHSASHRARAGFSFPFDPSARAVRFEQFRAEVFAGDPDADEKSQCLQEFGGACLIGRATRPAKALVLTGEGRNGKSTYQDIIAATIPEGAKESIPPHYWEMEYYREKLRGKLLNLVPELPKADILRSEAFKAITAGDTIVARAIRKAPIRFRPVAGHLFAANTLPAVDDASRAFWGRIIVIPFNNVFSVDQGNADTDLASTIIATELPGVVLWALHGAARLLSRGAQRRLHHPGRATTPRSRSGVSGRTRSLSSSAR